MATMSRIVFLVVLVALYVGSSDAQFKTRHVNITNKLEPETALDVHCKSKDDDLGVQTLGKNESWGFKFKVNFWSTTLFFCHFQWQNIDGKTTEERWFEIFNAWEGRSGICFWCYWEVHRDQICRWDNVAKRFRCYDYRPGLKSLN